MSVYMMFTYTSRYPVACARTLSRARSLQPQHPRDRLVSLFLPFLSKKQKKQKKVFTP